VAIAIQTIVAPRHSRESRSAGTLDRRLSSRLLLYLGVGAACLVAAGIVIALTLDTRQTPHQPKPASGKPPVPVGLTGPAAPQIVAAFKNWPHGSIDTMQRLGLQYTGGRTPAQREQSAIVQYYRGVALLWGGYPADAETALERAKRLGRDTVIQSRADNLLHPNFFQPASGSGYPVFVPLSKNPLLRRGSLLQAQGHQLSAERLYQQAARQDPKDAEALVAAAVGLFDEDNLVPAFSHLGPLAQRFPRSQIVHYYLGLLSAWTAQGQEAIKQFTLTKSLGPTTVLGKQADQFLAGLGASSSAR
jgi:tetratricopeptide (TPR) repeat protein